MALEWKVYPESPKFWLIAEKQISETHWLLCFKRPDGFNGQCSPDQEYLISVYPFQWYPRRKYVDDSDKLEAWRGEDELIFTCLMHEFEKRYGDERCENGGLRRAGDEA